MTVLLLDTNVVSILFKPDHPLHPKCFEVVAGGQWLISLMTRAELLLWPRVNRWGQKRREELLKHIDLCTTILPDEGTCLSWVEIVAESRDKGRPVTVADAWIAATARQWDLPLVTADHRDYQHISGLTIVPVL